MLALQPYDSARSQISGEDGLTLLDANENILSSAEFFSEEIPYLNRYPDPRSSDVLEKLSELYHVPEESILVSPGSDLCINYLIRAFCRESVDKILINPPTFGCYKIFAELQGCESIEVPLLKDAGMQMNVPEVIAKIESEAPKIVFLCSPNNPTGNAMHEEDIEAIVRAATNKAIIVIDEAYIEFTDRISWASRLEEFPHIAVMRTMSKYYGLAGVRLGCLIGHPDLISILRRVISAYPVPASSAYFVRNALTEENRSKLAEANKIILSERRRMLEALEKLDAVLHVYHSDANFILFEVSDRDAMHKKLLSEGIVVRKYGPSGNAVRLTIGKPEDNDKVLEVLAS